MATETLRPNAIGTTTNIQNIGWEQPPGPGEHYEMVDEVVADDSASYVREAREAYYTDTYGLPNHSLGDGTINSVTLHFKGKCNTVTAPGKLKATIRTHSTDYSGDEETPSIGWASYSKAWTENPNTTNDWTWAEIDALEAGVSMARPDLGHDSQCTQVYIVVDYNPSSSSSSSISSSSFSSSSSSSSSSLSSSSSSSSSFSSSSSSSSLSSSSSSSFSSSSSSCSSSSSSSSSNSLSSSSSSSSFSSSSSSSLSSSSSSISSSSLSSSSSSRNAEPAYINPNIFQIDFDDLDGWSNQDVNGGVSEIDPTSQLHLDLRSLSDDGIARRDKDLGTIGSGDYYVEVKFSGDAWDGFSGSGVTRGILMETSADPNRLYVKIGNDYTGGDGIQVQKDGEGFTLSANTWDNNWHRIVFYVHNSQTDVDIWIDKDPRTEGADATDVQCDIARGGADGYVNVAGWGSVAGNGRYHIDYIYVGDGLFSSSSSSSSSLSSSSSSVSSLSSSSSSSFSSSSSSSFSSSSSSSFSSSSSSSSLSSSSSSSSSFSSSSSSLSSSSSFSLSSVSSSSSCSSSRSSSSSSISSSSSSSSAYPVEWGIAWGNEDCPPTETPESWATWSDGAGGAVTVMGDPDWGTLFLGRGVVAHSPVHHFNALDSHTTLTKNKYGAGGVGSFKVYYRESNTPFLQDDGSPVWSLYTNPVRLTNAYRQVKLVGE